MTFHPLPLIHLNFGQFCVYDAPSHQFKCNHGLRNPIFRSLLEKVSYWVHRYILIAQYCFLGFKHCLGWIKLLWVKFQVACTNWSQDVSVTLNGQWNHILYCTNSTNKSSYLMTSFSRIPLYWEEPLQCNIKSSSQEMGLAPTIEWYMEERIKGWKQKQFF